jgi:site-specific DNA recombinase
VIQIRHLRPEDLRTLRWRGYVRESSEAQAEKWSPERQRQDIARAAEELGLVATDPLWYERTGSGEKASPELARALADAKAGQFDVLLIYTTSRFARNREEAVRVKGEFRRGGVPIYFVLERIISGTRQNSLLEGVREVVDQEENDTRRHWIAGGQRERMLSGRWLGNLPYGYRRLLVDFVDGTRGWDGGLEADPERAPVVRRIFDDFSAGMAPPDIARTLNADGIVHEGPWRRAGIVKMLRNPVYKGVMVRYRHVRPKQHYFPEADATDGRREINGHVPALLPEGQWESVQSLMDRRVIARSRQANRRPYPLSLLLRCSACGRGMSGVSNGYRRYYRCPTKGECGPCSAHHIRADVAEGAFAEWIGSLTLPPDWREAIARTRNRSVSTDRRPRLEGQLARLQSLYVYGDMDDATYRAESAKVKAELAEVVAPVESSMEDVAARLADLGAGWSKATPASQSVVARLMLREIVVTDGAVCAFVGRAEIKPLLEMCLPERVLPNPCLYADNPRSTADIEVRWSA